LNKQFDASSRFAPEEDATMHHLHYEIDANAGDVVEVVLDRAANVRLLDPANYEKYKRRQDFRNSGGGYVTVKPFRLTVPESGHWHVVIDLGGGAGQVKASVQLLSGTGV
jgi:Domain of unknown function (DUF1883)